METLTLSSANKNTDSYSKFIDALKHPQYAFGTNEAALIIYNAYV